MYARLYVHIYIYICTYMIFLKHLPDEERLSGEQRVALERQLIRRKQAQGVGLSVDDRGIKDLGAGNHVQLPGLPVEFAKYEALVV